MRRILHPPAYGLSGLVATACKTATGSLSGTGACLVITPMTLLLSARAQGGFGGGRPARGQRGGYDSRGRDRERGGGAEGKGGAVRRTIINKTGDGELSELTRMVMRDDSKILTGIVKHIPQNGAISVKSLHAQLSPDVQEAVAEKYNGLKSFLEQRKQLFVVKKNPADGVLYAAAAPLALQKLVAREKQRETMQEMLGLNRRGGGGGSGSGGGGNRGGRGNRGGGGNRDDRGGGGGGERFSRGRDSGGGGGGFRGRGSGGRMGGENRSFGTQGRR
ncbi:putative mitochondrial RNA binding complex 1 subunit [Trypanosoma rangeli]|uniref:Putative mitochondrial RNA binding complex 1 subunit n=1 Tax=Trypanosoma rangeli TaxID=5698 RepID=A0A422NGK6_TRYRA|nr:putative mitochondrial RNA binding complex 1 subunit [Trypanosoma rangeli]RNF04577.1 putative mitochondrial RNA binding complex 1 subunit [Trypanosoma rangeli]|eukprot:RNF04577.1 putative mitochondrial RNA binding complex 1 subunit [Trypanosoma rangeli]